MGSKRFVFNMPQAAVPADTRDLNYVYTNLPAIMLEEIQTYDRHEKQTSALPNRSLPGSSQLFGDDAGWAYREYRIHRLAVDDERESSSGQPDAPIGNAPPRPRSHPFRTAAQRLAELTDAEGALDEQPSEPLYLFNVIVAFEWTPTPERLRRMEWAFRRASEYLYDVTNGCMAFGQVIFADASWMDCADIQILASNRLLPRSWVGGLLLRKKYVPIRVGRGLWTKNRQVVVEWDEPEGYRALVHEWAHYALGLKDKYLKRQHVKPNGNKLLIGVPEGKAPTSDSLVVIPQLRVKSQSIMATAEGSSELDSPLKLEDGPFEEFREHNYPALEGSRLEQTFSGPGYLPLPLPRFRRVGKIRTGQPNERTIILPVGLISSTSQPNQATSGSTTTQGTSQTSNSSTTQPELFIELDEDGAPQSRWEVYVVRSNLQAPEQLIAQGDVDAYTQEHGFTLLGAKDDDTIVLIGGNDKKQIQVWGRLLGSSSNEGQDIKVPGSVANTAKQNAQDLTTDWELLENQPAAQPAPGAQTVAPAFLHVDVMPEPFAEGDDTTLARVRLDPAAVGSGSVRFFPLGGGKPVDFDPKAKDPISLKTLDGYVVTHQNGITMISSFSQGGGPRTAPNVPTNPIAAGAANGEALLFFDDGDVKDEKEKDEHARIRVVTSPLRGVSLPPDFVAHSPVFSIASNEQLPTEIHPTLLILNTQPSDESDQKLRIHRIEGGTPQPLPTFLWPGASFAAAPLKQDASGGKLTKASTSTTQNKQGKPKDEKRVERYVLGYFTTTQPTGNGGDIGHSRPTAEPPNTEDLT
jgi:hypothetical protein